jgi:DNA repair exonuclease SbcCD ATPase subunit
MRLLNFKATNLFSLGEVDLDLDKRGLLLVTGHSIDEGGANGSGKSSISNKGVLWTLYGSTASGDKADAVINRFAEADATCSGSLDVESGNGGKFRIVRSRRPNRLTLTDLATGQDISCKLEKDTQELINEILGRTKETFMQTDFFGQGKAANFLDLTPKAQVELLETILPFDQINELADVTKKNLGRLNVIAASVDKGIAEANGKLLEAQKAERQLSGSVDVWETKHYATMDKLKADIEQEAATDRIAETIRGIQSEVASMPTREEIYAKKQEIKLVFSTYNMAIKSYEDSEQAWNLFKDSIVRHPKPPSSPNCPTCGVLTSMDKFAKMVSDYEEMKLRLVEAEEGLKNCRDQLSDMRQQTRKLDSEITECQQLVTRHEQIDTQLARLEADRATNKLAILKENLLSVEADTNPYVSMHSKAMKNVSLLVSSLSHQKHRIEAVENDKRALEFWQTAFTKELKNEFIKQVCPFLQEKATIHLEGLGNGQIKVQVSTTKTLKSNEDRSEFSISVASTTGGATYDALSGGEKQMANFAFGLALADLAELQVDGPSYFMVLDEPFVSLDARNSENLVAYLSSYLSGKKETILLVSNEESLKSLVPNKIQVIKENGITRLE